MVTADDSETFIDVLCEMLPGLHRNECVRRITRRLLTMYVEHDATPPPGLGEFARRIGIAAGAGMS